MTDETREGWLGRAAQAIAEKVLYEQDVPPLRISVGFPGGRSNREKTIGQCWHTGSASDGVNQILMSPIRGAEHTRDVLGTLAHEMIHAIDDCQSGHRGEFARIAKSVGFLTKLTQSGNRTDELNATLDEIAADLGEFPHATLTTSARAADEPKKQSTRMIKVECPADGYIVRTTQKWLDIGTPTCPCGVEMVAAS